MKFLIALASLGVSLASASAHFIFILPPLNGSPARVVLNDGPIPDPKASLEAFPLKEFAVLADDGKPTEKKLTPVKDKSASFWAFDADANLGAGIAASIDYGVVNRGEGERYLVRHHAKLVQTLSATLQPTGLPIEITPKQEGSGIAFIVTINQKPAANYDVVVYEPDHAKVKVAKTDLAGQTATFSTAGTYAVRVSTTDATAGEFEGRRYKAVKHYSTLVVALPTR